MICRLLLCGLLSAGLALPATARADDRRIAGSLSYPERIALPPGAAVAVHAEGLLGTGLGEIRFETAGEQVPIAFELSVPAGFSGQVSAVVRVGGRPWWLVRNAAFPAGEASVDLGELLLTRVNPLAFATRFDCGGREVAFGVLDDKAVLRVDGSDIEMRAAPAASGARYVGVADETTEFWSKGTGAMLTLAGERMPDCVALDDVGPDYVARGNEPGWSVSIGASEVEVVTGYGTRTLRAPRPEVRPEAGAYVLDLASFGALLRLEDRLCRDDATGMPYPQVAELTLDGATLRGCGGDPDSLLAGPEWRIEDVAGQGIIDGSNITIAFDAGRVSGSTGCNRFIGGYTLGGEGLAFGQMGVTMMACPEALMAQERRILDALSEVHRFDFDATGALVLTGGAMDAPLLLARRP